MTAPARCDRAALQTAGRCGHGSARRARPADASRPAHGVAVPTGLAIAIPRGFEGQVRPRSGLALKHARHASSTRPERSTPITAARSWCCSINHGREPVTIAPGERIAQLVIAPVVQAELVEVDELPRPSAAAAASDRRGGESCPRGRRRRPKKGTTARAERRTRGRASIAPRIRPKIEQSAPERRSSRSEYVQGDLDEVAGRRDEARARTRRAAGREAARDVRVSSQRRHRRISAIWRRRTTRTRRRQAIRAGLRRCRGCIAVILASRRSRSRRGSSPRPACAAQNRTRFGWRLVASVPRGYSRPDDPSLQSARARRTLGRQVPFRAVARHRARGLRGDGDARHRAARAPPTKVREPPRGKLDPARILDDRGDHAPRRDRVPDPRRGARRRAGALAAPRA